MNPRLCFRSVFFCYFTSAGVFVISSIKIFRLALINIFSIILMFSLENNVLASAIFVISPAFLVLIFRFFLSKLAFLFLLLFIHISVHFIAFIYVLSTVKPLLFLKVINAKVTATGLEPTTTWFVNEHSTMIRTYYQSQLCFR